MCEMKEVASESLVLILPMMPRECLKSMILIAISRYSFSGLSTPILQTM